MTTSRQTELSRAFDDFKCLPFPRVESDDDEIDELRAELAEYDGYIAGIVSTVLGHAKPEHPLTRNHELARRLETLLRDKPAPAAQDARRLLDYLNALHALIGPAEASQEARALASLDAWNRWWRRRGEPGVRALLMALWDPIGVAGIPEARDEYDSYLLQVAKRLRAGASAEELAAYLSEVQFGAMGLAPNRPADLDVARKIRAWYESETGDFEDDGRG